MKKKILSIGIVALLITMLFLLAGCGKINYTDNMLMVREHFQPWYLSSNKNAGEIYDIALKNTKWTDENGIVTVSGTDKKSGEKIVVTYEIDGEHVEFISMTQNDEKKDYSDWYNYMTKYIDN